MNNGTQYHLGDNHVTPAGKKAKATPTGHHIYKHAATDQRCGKGHQRQTAVLTGTHAANGFLKCTFLPKAPQQEQPLNKNIEREFYHSLSQLVSHYGIETIPAQHVGFPYNVALSLWDTTKQLKETCGKSFNTLRLMQKGNKTFFLNTMEYYNTGTMLYYIPVLPIFRMLRDKESKQAASLLLSVCAYLYHIADIPYYRQQSTYLYWQYELLSDWIEQDGDENEEETARNKQELREAAWVGDRIEQKLFNRKNLEVFYYRIAGFIPRNSFDKDCLKLAKEAYSLYTNYPAERIFKNATYTHEEAERKEEVITMDKYISFIADSKGWLYDNLAEVVNNEFNEYGDIEEPTISKTFDGKPIENSNLDFENRLFPLVDDLCYLLNNYKNEMS